MKEMIFSSGTVKIPVGGDNPVFFIAEIGCNFEGDISRAKEMIVKAREAGAGAVKFQTFVPEKITTKNAEKFWDIEGCPGRTQYEEFKEMPLLTPQQYMELKRTADSCGILFASSPEDEDSADMLEEVGVAFFKISSMNITHIPLIRRVAAKGKPVIISTGASDLAEVKEALEAVRSEGNDQLALLHCTSNYPAKLKDLNLRMLSSMAASFPEYVLGYSDHTEMENSLEVIAGAVALGAKIVEKHFTFDRLRPGYDHAISAGYDELKEIIARARALELSLGRSGKSFAESEQRTRLFGRRSVVAAVDIPKGSRINEKMLAVKRPGTGLHPRLMGSLLGRIAVRDIKEDELIIWDMVSENA